MLTAIHSIVSGIGASIASFYLDFRHVKGNDLGTPYIKTLTIRENITIFLFSILYTANIAVSNISLSMVTLPFHQIVRSTNPVLTVLFERIWLGKKHGTDKYLSLAVVVIGVTLAAVGELDFNALGFILTVLGVFLSSIKGIVTNEILVGNLKLDPFDLLRRMAVLSFFQCVAIAYFSGEIELFYKSHHKAGIRTWDSTDSRTLTQQSERFDYSKLSFALGVNGLLAFFLNAVSFMANKQTSALSMTVAGNVKQAMSILLSMVLFSYVVSFGNGVGIILTLVGGAYYSTIALNEKRNEVAPVGKST